MVTAPMSPPVLHHVADQEQHHEVEGAELAELPLRLPQRRKATSRNTYTAAERNTFSAMLMSGTGMFMRLPLRIAPVATDRGRI